MANNNLAILSRLQHRGVCRTVKSSGPTFRMCDLVALCHFLNFDQPLSTFIDACTMSIVPIHTR